jgi:hypothetical protein
VSNGNNEKLYLGGNSAFICFRRHGNQGPNDLTLITNHYSPPSSNPRDATPILSLVLFFTAYIISSA